MGDDNFSPLMKHFYRDFRDNTQFYFIVNDK